jgi:hypothetical protein
MATVDIPGGFDLMRDGRALLSDGKKMFVVTDRGVKREIYIQPDWLSAMGNTEYLTVGPNAETNFFAFATADPTNPARSLTRQARFWEDSTGLSLLAFAGSHPLDRGSATAPPLNRTAVSLEHVVRGSGFVGSPGNAKPGPNSQCCGYVYRYVLQGNAAGYAGAATPVYAWGVRAPRGLTYDSAGRLWELDEGPNGGDELNLIVSGGHYGWPWISNGSNADGSDIPDHRPGDGYVAPALTWNPGIGPAGLAFYAGTLFPGWNGDAIVGAAAIQSLIRVRIAGETATEVQRLPIGVRMREVRVAPDGAIWILEDGPGARLLRLTPSW